MKNILVATDFSGCAINAMNMGLALAEYFDATIHYLNTMDDTRNGEALGFSLLANSVAEKAYIEHVNVLFRKWEEEAIVRNVKIKTICTSGKMLPVLKDYVDKNHIDFVVMGSHGHSGVKGFFIGSNCQKVVRALHVPVFILKDKAIKYEFKNVVFASNFDLNEKEPFLKFLDFIKWFTPETIHLLSINTSGWFGQPSLLMKEAMKDFKLLCDGYNCKTHFYRDLSVDVGVRHFAEEVEADLIVVSNQNLSLIHI